MEIGPVELPGGPHEAGGNAGPRWMAATPGNRGTGAGLQAGSSRTHSSLDARYPGALSGRVGAHELLEVGRDPGQVL